MTARRRVPARRILSLAPVIGLALLASGCGSSSSTTAAPTGAGATTTAPSTAPPAAAPATTAPPPTTAPRPTTPALATVPTTAPSNGAAADSTSATTVVGGAAPLCRTADLHASIGSPDGTAGGVDLSLELRNAGPPCSILGYPGVSAVAGSTGQEVGAAAYRIGGSTPEVVLLRGDGAIAVISVADAGNFPSSCGATTAQGFRVYPPDSTVPLFVPLVVSMCRATSDRTLGVGPMHPS